MNMKMKKADMIKEILEVAEQGIELATKRKDLIAAVNNFEGVISNELTKEGKEIIYMSDSFPNFWFGNEANLKREKKEELIKIYVLYVSGKSVVEAANIELNKLLDKIANCKETLPEKLQRALDESNLEGEDPDIYATIYKFFSNANDEEIEALYCYIADWNGISNGEQCTDEQIDLLYAKGYLANQEDSTCTELECENSLDVATWHGNSCKENGCTDAIISNCRLAETCDKCFDGWMKMHPGLTCQDVYDLDNPDVGDVNKT